MHKLKGRRGYAGRSHGNEERKTPWLKFLLVPVTLGAIAVVGRTACDHEKTEALDAKTDSVAAAPAIEDMTVMADTRSGAQMSVAVPGKEIETVLDTHCCEMAVERRGSKLIPDIISKLNVRRPESFEFGRNEEIRGLTVGRRKGDDGQLRGFFLVVHPLDAGDEIDLYENNIFASFTPAMRELILDTARRGSVEEMKQLAERIVSELPFNEGESMFRIHRQVEQESGKDAADLLFRKIAAGTILKKSLDARAGEGTERMRVIFLNMVTHETVHAAMLDYPAPGDAHEIFGHLSQVAYGNCWHGLYRFAMYSATYLVEPILQYGDDFEGLDENARLDESTRGKLEIELRWRQFFSALLSRLMEKLSITNPLELLGKSENEIRTAAREILDEEAVRNFGKHFEEIVHIADIESMKSQAAAYFDAHSAEW